MSSYPAVLVEYLPHCSVQWGLTSEDPGTGDGTFMHPITFSEQPFQAIACCAIVANAEGTAVIEMYNNRTVCDNFGMYKGAYRVIVIGK